MLLPPKLSAISVVVGGRQCSAAQVTASQIRWHSIDEHGLNVHTCRPHARVSGEGFRTIHLSREMRELPAVLCMNANSLAGNSIT